MAKMSAEEAASIAHLSEAEAEALREAGELPGGAKPEVKSAKVEDEDDPLGLLKADEDEDEEEDPPESDAEAVAAAALAAIEKSEAPAAKKEDATPAETDPVVLVADDDDDFFVPSYRPDPARMAVVTTRLTEIDAERAQLRKEFGEGDLDQDVYLEKSDKLTDERTDLVAEKMAAEKRESDTLAELEDRWQRDQKKFWNRPENEVFDEDKDPVMYRTLKSQYEVTRAAYEKAGIEKNPIKILAEAANTLRTKFGLAGAPKPEATVDPKRAAATARAKQQADEQKKVPKSLAGVPAAKADDDDVAPGRFDDLDKMLGSDDPEQQYQAERIIANMKTEDRRAYETMR